jgi:hypothetical protein
MISNVINVIFNYFPLQILLVNEEANVFEVIKCKFEKFSRFLSSHVMRQIKNSGVYMYI